ncbi:MAG TPA: DUF2059 domain-containing protein [Burkholderiales bacterium]|nr:DUF2059 domain-containing protein [Burkholderiales bacterium]
MRTIIFCFLILTSSACFSADRTDKVRVLMEAQGLVQMFEQQIDAGKVEGRQQAKQVLDQFMVQLKPTKEFDARFRSAFEEYLKSLEVPWTAQDIVGVWAKVYGERFTDQELDDLVAYYTSALGKKDVMATQASLPELTNHFYALSKPLLERATKDFIQRLQLIANECKCKK